MTQTRSFSVRIALPSDVPACPEIERAAGLLYKTHPDDLGIPEEMCDQPNPVEAFAAAQADGQLWIAAVNGVPVGFAMVHEVAGYAHLDELDVLPAHGRQGMGSALLKAVCEWAREKNYPAVTLRTFRDVPWNAPFYERRGFKVIDSSLLSEEHVGLEYAEQGRGLRTDYPLSMLWECR